ncbi:TetR/AcrR family transcriptional regulator [Ktedonobacter racemifer]|uniref:Transcriptional regulator, TetR family n=1 Tax=Ktedonobacter racemifer DSM 44963 TaxID=485913 RepID=D6TKA5_KTERA|nr:TetR/AcrR family transcriptional regulator [Ktedonobacter racemifer]EFH86205.1 transcriptional regulator, TetR family [Ktedonobacter racemifer DSM 44963]
MEQEQTSEQAQTLKEKQRQERERLILAAAEEVLYEKGYHDTSIDEIAARVGVAKGTVYLHFPSKEELVFAVFLHNFDAFVRAIDEALNEGMPPRQQLETILTCMYGGFYIKQIQLLYNSVDMKRLFEARREQEPRPWEQLAARIASILEAGKAHGDFDSVTPTSVQVATFFSLLSPRSYERLVLGEHMDVQELVQYLKHIYFNGITAHKE